MAQRFGKHSTSPILFGPFGHCAFVHLNALSIVNFQSTLRRHVLTPSPEKLMDDEGRVDGRMDMPSYLCLPVLVLYILLSIIYFLPITLGSFCISLLFYVYIIIAYLYFLQSTYTPFLCACSIKNI